MGEDQKRILIVEDEDRISTLLVDTLKAKGYQPVAVRDGQRAIDYLEKNRVDMVLTDLMLPRVDGFGVISFIRGQDWGKKLPILLMSAVYRDLRTRERALREFGVEFLAKPFSLPDLLGSLSRHLSNEPATGQPEARSEPSKTLKPPMSASVSGKLEHFSVPLLLVSFFNEDRTGTLELRQGNRVLRLFLRKGTPVFAEGRSKPQDSQQVREALRSAFSWTSGDYLFTPSETLQLPEFAEPQDLLVILYEGAHRYYRLEMVMPLLASFERHRVVREIMFATKIGNLPLSDAEKTIVAAIDDQKTVAQLIGLGGSAVEGVFQTLWLLHFLKLISFQTSSGN